jgi:hypothetical protein
VPLLLTYVHVLPLFLNRSTRRRSFQHSFKRMSGSLFLIIITLSSLELVSSSSTTVRSQIAPVAPNATQPAAHMHERIHERQASAPITTCGYLDGNPQNPRTADPGYVCRVDTANGLWGFCPTSVSSAKDCGLAGLCIDNHSCTTGCGRLFDRADITTFTWLVAPLPYEYQIILL